MAWTLYQVTDLSNFSGAPLASYNNFAVQAIAQATLMFMVVTELSSPPTDPTDNSLAQNGILAMADTIYLEQPYRQIKASPMQDESLGSYHWSKPIQYTRGTAAAAALKGESTGVTWWDLAVQTLSLRQRRGGVFSGSIKFMEREWDDVLKVDKDGRAHILGPADMNQTNGIFFDINGEIWPSGGELNTSHGPRD